jgi:membrane-associated protease RseP (regulator of RpoE activity)
VDSLGRLLNSQYRERVALHEAGHFLVAYLVGVLPRAYTLSAWDAFTRWGWEQLPVAAGPVAFG